MDAKEIIKEELKAAGLDMAEDAAIAAMKALFRALPKVALATPNKWDDMVIPIAAIVEPKLVEALEGIYKGDNDPEAA